MPLSNVPIIIYDGEAVSHFLRSVAIAVASEAHTSMYFAADTESSVMGTIYMALWDELPGTTKVHVGMAMDIRRTTDSLHQKYMYHWLHLTAKKGPWAGQLYLEQKQKDLETAEKSLNAIFAAANDANLAALNRTQNAIRTLAVVKLAAGITIAVITGGVGIAALSAEGGTALTLWGIETGSVAWVEAVNLGYSVSGSLIHDWHKGVEARCAAVRWEDGKFLANKALEYGIDKLKNLCLMRHQNAKAIYEEARLFARKLSIQVASGGLKGAARRRLAKEAGKAGEASGAAKRAMKESGGWKQTFGKTALTGVSVLFAAIDVYDAVDEFSETWDEAQ